MAQGKLVFLVDEDESVDEALRAAAAREAEAQTAKEALLDTESVTQGRRSIAERWALFKDTVLARGFNWFLNTHISTIASTYTMYQNLNVPLYGMIIRVKKRLFSQAFPFDGLDTGNGMVTAADGQTAPINGISVPKIVYILAFLGLPSRLESIEGRRAKFSFLQFLRNLVGGLNPVKETITGESTLQPQRELSVNKKQSFSQRRWTEKKIISAILFLFKLLVIAPIKLITFPFKLLLNVVKLVTEVLLPIVSGILAVMSAYMILGVKYLVLGLVGYEEGGRGRSSSYEFGWFNLIYLIPLAIVFAMTTVYSVVQYALIWVCRIALAITSPEKSARNALEAGKKFLANEKGEYESGFHKWASYIMGGLGATLSLAITAFSWMILLPLTLSGVVTVFPSLIAAVNWIAQLPFVTTSLAWLSQWPVITGSAALVNSFFGIVGGGLVSVFGPAVTTIASLISVQIPATVLTVGMTLGLIFIPVAAVVSRGLDELSNLWAKWVEQAPVAAIKAKLFGASAKKVEVEKGEEAAHDDGAELQPLVGYVLSEVPPKADESVEDSSQEAEQSSKLYVYQPVAGGTYIASPKALYLVLKHKEYDNQVDQFLEGIILRGENARAVKDRAENVGLKGLRTQGVRFASPSEEQGNREKPAIPAADILGAAKSVKRPNGDAVHSVFRPTIIRTRFN